MTIKVFLSDMTNVKEIESEPSDQVLIDLLWESRGKEYNVSQVTFTHNPEYPTPAINVVAPNPGIRFTVQDHDGNVVYSNVKPKEEKS